LLSKGPGGLLRLWLLLSSKRAPLLLLLRVVLPLGGALEVLELLTPVMAAATLLLSLVWEKLWVVLPGSIYFNSPEHCLLSLGIVFFGAIIAFLMVWTEYQVGRSILTLGL
jgi:hypothetical protein